MPRRKPAPKDVPAQLLDLLEAAEAVSGFVKDKTIAQYQTDLLLRSAVERQLEIMGEAARRVSVETRSKHPSIPREKIVRTRHRVSHEYDTLDHSIIWRIASEHVPALVLQLRPLIPEQLF